METDRRSLMKFGGAALAASVLTGSALGREDDESEVAQSKSNPPAEFRVQRLTWAGIKLVYKKTTLLLDPLISTDIWEGAWKSPVVPITIETERRFAVVTHMHNDHFDPAAIHSAEKGNPMTVVCHESKAPYVAGRGLRVAGIPMYEPTSLGDFVICPVPAVDGLREFQVSWVVSAGGKRVIHCGDTLWHASFWYFGEQYGPFDAAFLPINGAKLAGREPASDVNISMTPTHAVAAGIVMRAKLAIPIHHGLNDPGTYVEHPNAVQEFKSVAEMRKQAYKFMEPGEWITL